MIVRSIPGLEDLLLSLTRFDPKDNSYKCLKVSDKRDALTHVGDAFTITERYVWYKVSNSDEFDTCIRYLKKVLSNLNHPSSDEIVHSILLLYTHELKTNTDPFLSLEFILKTIQKVQLTQYFLPNSKMQPGFTGFKFGNFALGSLDIERFAYRCSKATSNYYELYESNLKNRFAIERDYFDVNIIVWQDLADKNKIASNEFSNDLLIYYEHLSGYHFEGFWEEFIEQQSLQISIGIGYIESNIFRRSPNSTLISIYSNIKAFKKNVGYVVPELNSFMNINVSFQLINQMTNLKSDLQSKFAFDAAEPKEIHNSISTYSRFNAKGYIYLYENRTDEAFLHFVIALDLLLGSKGESTDSVSSRAAVLTFMTYDKSYDDQKNLIKKIYGARSKYVHAGKSVDRSLLDDLKKICKIILNTLLILQAKPNFQAPGSIEKWLNELDIIIKTLGTEYEPEEFHLLKLGIEKRNNLFLPID